MVFAVTRFTSRNACSLLSLLAHHLQVGLVAGRSKFIIFFIKTNSSDFMCSRNCCNDFH